MPATEMKKQTLKGINLWSHVCSIFLILILRFYSCSLTCQYCFWEQAAQCWRFSILANIHPEDGKYNVCQTGKPLTFYTAYSRKTKLYFTVSQFSDSASILLIRQVMWAAQFHLTLILFPFWFSLATVWWLSLPLWIKLITIDACITIKVIILRLIRLKWHTQSLLKITTCL
jgi:hypothetical protein